MSGCVERALYSEQTWECAYIVHVQYRSVKKSHSVRVQCKLNALFRGTERTWYGIPTIILCTCTCTHGTCNILAYVFHSIFPFLYKFCTRGYGTPLTFFESPEMNTKMKGELHEWNQLPAFKCKWNYLPTIDCKWISYKSSDKQRAISNECCNMQFFQKYFQTLQWWL